MPGPGSVVPPGASIVTVPLTSIALLCSPSTDVCDAGVTATALIFPAKPLVKLVVPGSKNQSNVYGGVPPVSSEISIGVPVGITLGISCRGRASRWRRGP